MEFDPAQRRSLLSVVLEVGCHAASEYIRGNQTHSNIYDSCKEQLLQLPGIVINSPEQGIALCAEFFLLVLFARRRCCTFWHPNISLFPAVLRVLRESASHVLTAMGLDRARIQTAIRVSFSRENTQQDVNVFIEAVKDGLSSLATGK